MKNFNLETCVVCEEPIDTAKARTDPKHEYVRTLKNNKFFHRECWNEYSKELSDRD